MCSPAASTSSGSASAIVSRSSTRSAFRLNERAPRFNEAIGLMRRLWTEDRVTHQGRFYTVNDHGISLKPVRAGGPPV